MSHKCNILNLSSIISEIDKRQFGNSNIIDVYLKYSVVDWFLSDSIEMKIIVETPENLKDLRSKLTEMLTPSEEISEDGFIRILNGETPYLVFENIETMNIFLLTWR